ncbi:diacylglycerol kinase [Thalassoporum mexicanum PCC 7367]|uniref:diacylglycerol kinase family protein n=1 Tax=Thalassoporum mexicanum TaxID=3457544 RepID=UPI00029FFDB6|nr:diacylglycerol kinase family protein [Pseudanabaena sp. PCC 7367]AFY69290.1 diacylglycerol kinase [Pseudanabaena sp. PCC 7367]
MNVSPKIVSRHERYPVESDQQRNLQLDLKSWQRSQAFQVAPNLIESFRFAGAGLVYAFTTQRNFRIHTVVSIVVLSLSIYLQLSMVEVAIISLTAGAVMVMELINTALEAVVDLCVGQSYHQLAKIAKDCAAGAVLIAAIVSVVVGFCLLAPPLWLKLFPGVNFPLL